MVRKYELKKRAERQQETRRRIAQAVYELHASVGPASTTVKGVAEQAGVDRVTVYRHFPDELSLHRACLEHWTTERPLPDESAWASIEDPQDRIRVALRQLYRHYETNEGLWSNGWRDIPRLPLLMQADAPVFAHFERMRAVLMQGWPPGQMDERVLSAVIAHALEFPTWESLIRRQGLPSEHTIELVVRWLSCLVAGPADGHDRG
jgi:AcrR family transcriptional regulator